MKTVLLTGHLGFIGTHLKQYLESKQYTILGLDIKEGQDILTADLPNCDAVIHLAALTGVRNSLSDATSYWQVNVDGTRRILEHYKNTRVVVAGSSSQYEPYRNPYAASKYVIETIPHSNVCFARLHTVYSDNPREDMFFDKLLNGKLTYVTNHRRDFVHVNDVCRAFEILLESSFCGSLDIGTGRTICIKDIRLDLPIQLDTPFERPVTCANTAIAKSLGFEAQYNIEDFIRNKVRR